MSKKDVFFKEVTTAFNRVKDNSRYKVIDLVDAETGEYKPTKEYQYKWNDPSPFIKVYHDKIALLASLSSSGRTVFFMLLWVLSLPENKDTSFINFGHLAKDDFINYVNNQGEDIKLSENTFISGRKELIDKNIISRYSSDHNMYQVNPSFIFNGNRIKGYFSDIKKVGEKENVLCNREE